MIHLRDQALKKRFCKEKQFLVGVIVLGFDFTDKNNWLIFLGVLLSVELVKHKYSLALCSLLAQRKFKVAQFMKNFKNCQIQIVCVLLLAKVEDFEVQFFRASFFSNNLLNLTNFTFLVSFIIGDPVSCKNSSF
jgi:hypothetical protein